ALREPLTRPRHLCLRCLHARLRPGHRLRTAHHRRRTIRSCSPTWHSHRTHRDDAMTVYPYSQARQRLADVLDEAARTGAVRIRRRDGSEFDLVPAKQEPGQSPLDVGHAGLDVTREEIVNAIRESREREEE